LNLQERLGRVFLVYLQARHNIAAGGNADYQAGSSMTEEPMMLNFFMNAPAAIAITHGPQHVFTFANPLYQKIFGRDESQLLNSSIREVWPEFKDQGIYEIFDGVFRTGVSYSARDFPATFFDQGVEHKVYFDYTIHPTKDTTGSISDIMILAVDVTDRVLADQKVKRSEQRLHDLSDAMPQLVWIALSDMKIIYFNARVSAFHPVEKMSDGTWNWQSIIHPEDIEATQDVWNRALAEGETYEKEHRILMRDGAYRWHLSRALPQRDAAGNISQWYGSSVDIHHQKLNERRLQFLASLTQSIGDAVIATDHEFTIISWNEGAEHMYGWKSAEVVGKNAAALLPTTFRDGERAEWEKTFKEKGKWTGQVVQRTKDGEPIHVYASLSSIKNESGDIVGTIAVNRNITALKEAEERIRLSEEKFRIALEAGELGTYDFYPQVGKLNWSAKTKEFFGLAPDAEVDYETYLRRLHPDDRQRLDRAVQNALAPASGGVFENEYRTIGASDGRMRWIRSKGRIVYDENNKPTRFTGITQDITQQKEMLTSLQLQSLVLERMDEGVSVTDENGVILLTNPAEEKMFGYGKGALVGKHMSVQMAYPPPGNQERVIQMIKEVKSTGNWSGEWHNLKKSGEEFYTCATVTSLEVNESHLFICVHRDVTDEKKHKDELKESEQRFRNLTEALPQLVWVTNERGDREYVSKQWLDYAGVEKFDESVWEKTVHPDDRGPIRERWRKTLQEGTDYLAEVRLKHKSGEYRWHIVQGSGVRNSEGNILKWVGAFTDIHDQKTLSEKLETLVRQRTEELELKNKELFNARGFLQTVLDSSLEMVVSFDKELRYTFVNRKAEEFLNLKSEDVIGKSLGEVHPGIEDSAHFNFLKEGLNGKLIHVDQRAPYSASGKILETYIIPYIQAGRIEGVITLQRDITSLIRLTEELKNSNSELQRSNLDLQQFAHVTSHDLKEPVRKIKTFGGLLRDEVSGNISTRAAGYLRKIEMAAERISALIDGILQYSTVDSVQDAITLINLQDVMESFIEDLEVVISQSSATITFNDLPSVEGIPILIHQLFYNLINNSLKFRHPDRPPVIHVSATRVRGFEQLYGLPSNEDYAQLTITDNGIGFRRQYAVKIFESFTRLNSKDKFEGTGLGLALCKKIVERHHGVILATGQEGEGATFTVVLPLRQPVG